MPHDSKQKGIRLLDWYRKNRRDLPWRRTCDPYKIWISEIMLQQTRVDTVIEYYHRFMEKFPDIRTLAEAGQDEVLLCWKGLGYYSRAKNLHKAAQKVVRDFEGRFPETFEEVKGLPGIGPYTAGAILSIAYNQPYAAVDGNVLRVIARLEGLEDDIAADKTKRTVADLALQMLPEGTAGDFTQALMELGALVCVTPVPRCDECPVGDMCFARRHHRQEELPVRAKKAGPSPEYRYWMAVVLRERRILLEYRQHETLLGELWGFPMVEKAAHRTIDEQIRQKYGLEIRKEKFLGNAVHVFTHRVWHMEVVQCTMPGDAPLPQGLSWIAPEGAANLAIPTAFQKVLKLIPKDDY